MSDKALFEHMIQALRSSDLRITNQRNEILKFIISNQSHVDAENILNTLKKKNIHISRATIYRTLDILVQNNIIDKIDFGDGKFRYEILAGQTHHDHLICIQCGKIVEFFDPVTEHRQKQVCDNYDYKYVSHTHQIYGLCPKCKNKKH